MLANCILLPSLPQAQRQSHEKCRFCHGGWVHIVIDDSLWPVWAIFHEILPIFGEGRRRLSLHQLASADLRRLPHQQRPHTGFGSDWATDIGPQSITTARLIGLECRDRGAPILGTYACTPLKDAVASDINHPSTLKHKFPLFAFPLPLPTNITTVIFPSFQPAILFVLYPYLIANLSTTHSVAASSHPPHPRRHHITS